MTVLDAAQSAMIRLVGRKPAGIFTSQDQTEIEIANLVQEVATDIAKAHDWRALMKLSSVEGDGTRTEFSLPDDYDRMPVKAEVHSSTWQSWCYQAARDPDEWIILQTLVPSASPGYWIMMGGKFCVLPAIPSGESAMFYYLSNNIAKTSGNAPISIITSDSDKFCLSERLLTLGLIWKWRSQKKLDYAEDLKNYEIALSQEAGKDRGSQIIRTGTARSHRGVGVAYPGALG